MQFVGKMISSVSEFYRDINPSTLSGAIDVVVVENVSTGELVCSPFHVRFGKLQLLRPQEKIVELRVNGVEMGEELRMKVGEAGETFFVLARDEIGLELPPEYLTSPLIRPETPPVPIESIEEFKLVKGIDRGIVKSDDKMIQQVLDKNTEKKYVNSVELAPVPIYSSKIVSESAQISILNSPEWKWEWGDLPIKKETSESDDHEENSAKSTEMELEKESSRLSLLNRSAPLLIVTKSVDNSDDTTDIVSTNRNTIELYEFLSDREYLSKVHKTLKDFSVEYMKTKIYKIDRGLHFKVPSVWSDELFSLIKEESCRELDENEFLKNPNLVIEESSRLIYRFMCKNEKIVVIVGGSVGAGIVFYAQVYSKILPLDLLIKLGQSDLSIFREFEAPSLEDQNKSQKILESKSDECLVDSPSKSKSSVDANINSVTCASIEVNRVGWRSWWSRSSSASASISSPNSIEHVTTTSTSTSTNININTNTNTNTNANANTNIASSPLNQYKSSLKEIPLTLTVLMDKVEGNESGIEHEAGVEAENSPTKRVIQRTSSSTGLNEIVNISPDSNLNLKSNPSISLSQTTGTNTITSTSEASNTNTNANNNTLLLSSIPPKKFIKSLRLPSHLLKKLNLKTGVNTISYTVNTRLQGTATCQSRIFYWRSDARVVISDIDGTITKSDALGHLFTMVGKDWTHVGVASLYSKIAKNGYEFLYLTSRAIGQAASTRGYLKGVEQDRLQLPDGPVIMSPDRLFTALHREVIQRRPDEFKIACLRDIQKLFVEDEEEVSEMGSGVVSSSEDEDSVVLSRGSNVHNIPKLVLTTQNKTINNFNPIKPLQLQHQNPFYAGFGNRPTDTKSYKAVGISASRIFLINPAGDLKLDKLTFYTPYSASSYLKLTEEVDKVFPPVRSPSSLTRMGGDEAFTDFQFWHGDARMDLVEMALESVAKRSDIKGSTGSIGSSNNNNNNNSHGSLVMMDKSGKPLSPETLQMQLGNLSLTNSTGSSSSRSRSSSSSNGNSNSNSNSNSNRSSNGISIDTGNSINNNSSGVSIFSTKTNVNRRLPKLPPKPLQSNENDADFEESDDEEESEGDGESVDSSFPFL